jgi:hypothetical protein
MQSDYHLTLHFSLFTFLFSLSSDPGGIQTPNLLIRSHNLSVSPLFIDVFHIF